jgi:hypothetical protein
MHRLNNIKMSKPILIVKFPISYLYDNVVEFTQKLNSNTELVNDYFLFTIPNSTDEFDFKVFNGEYVESEYKELIELIEELKNQ